MHDSETNAANGPRQLLEEHFRHHARLVNHFRSADARAVVTMWEIGANAAGASLSQFERDALVERHCELYRRSVAALLEGDGRVAGFDKFAVRDEYGFRADAVIWMGVAIPVAILCAGVVTWVRDSAARFNTPAPY